MLSREAKKEMNTEFWGLFRKEMRKYKSSNGFGMNWTNYPSDVKYVYIRMETDGKSARLCMDIQAKDEGIRSIIWEQMTELKKVLEAEMNWETVWIEHFINKDGLTLSRIKWEKEGVNFFHKEDWPEIMSFLKDRIIEFDVFYQEFKDILIALAE